MSKYAEAAHKPSSVIPKKRDCSHSSKPWSYGQDHAALPVPPPCQDRDLKGPLSTRNLFGLAPGGVYQAVRSPVTLVSSYLSRHLPCYGNLPVADTFSPFPREKPRGGFPFCGTFLLPHMWETPHYGAPYPVELGLSSPCVPEYVGATTCSAPAL